MNKPGQDETEDQEQMNGTNVTSHDPGERHERARDLTEKAMDAYVSGDQKEGNRLVNEAKEIDPSAVMEIIEDLEEDAQSHPDTTKQEH